MRKKLLVLFLLLTLSSLFALGKKSISFAETPFIQPKQLRNIVPKLFRSVCSFHFNGMARCLAHVVTDNVGIPLGSSVPYASSYGPVQFHTGYNLPCTPGGPSQSICSTPGSFGGQTIAIVDAYNAPHIESDVNTFSNHYGLPPCTRANGCLKIVNEYGGTTLPATNSDWALEISLDVEVAHEICQTCKILLVEAYSSFDSDLGKAVNTAAQLGATEISNSYGGSEWSGETSYDTSYYRHPGIVVTASSGDSGYGAEFPAASANVVAVGGTTLQLNTDDTYGTESVWSGTGSGCSSYESANSWQKNLSDWNQTFCGSNRAVADVSADADPNTGAAVYDSTPYYGSTGWYQVGGTSLASPLIAGAYALAGGVSANTNASSIPYLSFTNNNSHNITQGSNGSCGTIMCNAAAGYNGPAGLGTPNGDTGFHINTVTPSPTPTPTPTVLPSLSPTPTVASGSPTPTSVITPTATPTPTNTPTPSPSPAPSPTPKPVQTLTFGYTSVGNYTDVFDGNYIDGSRFKTGSANGTLKSISVYVASVDTAPNNQYQVAIYSDNGGNPGTLLAQSTTGTLTANSWNTLPVSASLNANTYYWLVYNTNTPSSSLNELKFTTVSGLMGVYSSNQVAFGTWPQNFGASLDSYEYSMYATYTSP